MAEGSRVSLRLKEEGEWAVSPSGQYVITNFSEESLMLNKTKERKKRVLPTREYAGMVSKTQQTEGGFDSVLQANNSDALMEGVMMSVWSDVVGGTGGGSITAGASGSNLEIVFTIESGAGVGGTITFGSGITHNIAKDQVIFVNGATDAANNGAFIVKGVSGQVVTVNSALVTATYESACVISGDVIRNGNTLKSYTVERAHLDISKFFRYVGTVINSMETSFEIEEEVMLSFDTMGKSENTASDTISDPAPADGANTPDFVTGDNVDGIFVDYEALANCKVQDLNFTVSNQIETRKGVAVFGPCGIRLKPVDVTGSITFFFEDLEQYVKYPLDTEFQLTIIIGDSLGNKYSFTLAKVEFTTGTANTSDVEDEVPEEHEFAGSSNGQFTYQICRYLV